MMASTERLVEGYEGNTVIVLVRSAQSVATRMVGNLQDLQALASVAIATLFQGVLPTIDSLRIDACEALPESDLYMPNVCYSNYTLLDDLHIQSDEFVTLISSSLSQKMGPVKSFLKSVIDAGADTLADAAVVVDPLEPWMIQMAMGVGGLVAFVASIFLATLYLPSVVSTTLRFRCGISLDSVSPRISSLYRSRLHHITFLTGYVSSNASFVFDITATNHANLQLIHLQTKSSLLGNSALCRWAGIRHCIHHTCFDLDGQSSSSCAQCFSRQWPSAHLGRHHWLSSSLYRAVCSL